MGDTIDKIGDVRDGVTQLRGDVLSLRRELQIHVENLNTSTRANAATIGELSNSMSAVTGARLHMLDHIEDLRARATTLEGKIGESSSNASALAELAKRVEKLEDKHSKILWYVLGLLLSVIGFGAAFLIERIAG